MRWQRAERRPLTRLLAAAALLIGVQCIGPLVDVVLWGRITFTWWLTFVAIDRWPARRDRILAISGALVLLQWRPAFALFELPFVVSLWVARRRPWVFAALLVTAIVVPKELFRRFYHHTWTYDWVAEYALGEILFTALLWWRERQRWFVSPERWASLFLFPSQPPNQLPLSPTDLWRAPTATLRDAAQSLLLTASKGLVLLGLRRAGASLVYAAQTAPSLAEASFGRAWLIVGFNYLLCMLTLSATQDAFIVVARVLGAPLRHPFRFALLAWNPVELWRRWNIYNRRLLITLVYAPLGGSTKRRFLNVMLTFAASALALHTGWLGSKYWEVGAAGWRDQLLYFTAQGLAVCLCLGWWSVRGKAPDADRRLRWSWTRVAATLATQAMSAWLHIIVLAPALDWTARARLLRRCLGL